MKLHEALIKKFGSINNIYREEKDFSISRSHLYRIISGEINPKIRMLEEIAELLDQPVIEVLNMFKDYEDKLE
jgi:transcriptional regulator with XRE-family HTH domain